MYANLAILAVFVLFYSAFCGRLERTLFSGAVVEAAFDIQPFTDVRRDSFVRHHGFAKSGISRGDPVPGSDHALSH
ncbi:MAG: hypothetical protein PVJ25_05520 [Desulfuromonadales bacterium]|jgi:hypothetical protein